jgi:hypothetical protein
MRRAVAVFLFLVSTLALAQESKLQAEFRREGERVGDACGSFGLMTVPKCGYELFTDHPLHIAAGSMPPQNGFGLGAAFVWSQNTENWRMSWDVDAVGATSGAWRAGIYMKLIHTPPVVIKPLIPSSSGAGSSSSKKENKPTLVVHPYTVFNLYAQSISLNKLNFFGLGNNTSLAGASVFGMSQTIIGANVVKPVFELPAIRKLNLALLGEINGRLASIRGASGQSVPSIQTLYTNTTAPGLSSQPGFVQLGEGLRIKPVIADYFQINYLANFQQFFSPSSSHNSFLRWTIDLDHTFYLYGYTQTTPHSTDTNGPNSCAPAGENCPPIPKTRNLNGSLGARLLVSESINSASSAVPFYLQQTLGGQDINSTLSLGSYQDYRFRAPNLLIAPGEFRALHLGSIRGEVHGRSRKSGVDSWGPRI